MDTRQDDFWFSYQPKEKLGMMVNRWSPMIGSSLTICLRGFDSNIRVFQFAARCVMSNELRPTLHCSGWREGEQYLEIAIMVQGGQPFGKG